MPHTDPPMLYVTFEKDKGGERVLAAILRLRMHAAKRRTTEWPCLH